jgi:2-polyprenyl-6-methoxyphenol hydroxylase-like FAD-dependent oxidoreductase
VRTDDVLIAGGGIGGLTLALSLHQAGLSVQVFESVERIQALGVGINLLPHAVRELDAMGLADELAANGVTPSKLAYFTKRGELIWDEPRGIAAGYRWPQISIHRGELHLILHAAVLKALGVERVHTGCHLEQFTDTGEGVEATFVDRRTGAISATASGSMLVACDGIHSVVRRRFYPDEGMPKWNGSLLWRGLAEGAPVLDGRTLVWAGHPRQKFVLYPVRDLAGGRQLLNFIAEYRTDSTELLEREDWNKAGELDDFLPRFTDWVFPWLDVPATIRAAPGTFLFPMVDRDPVDRWSFGRVTLLGDAAHPMYPIGSNGASQAILDARTLTGCLRSYPAEAEKALERYDSVRRPPTAAIVMANRGLGPELPMQLVEDRAPHGFANLADVITPEEILDVTDGYRQMAGFSLQQLQNRPSLADMHY